jgi:Protein of unknown function (DUF3592)
MRAQKSGNGTSWLIFIVITLAALPFLLGAAYTAYRSLWFQYAAQRAEGTIVEVSEGTPELKVEFRTKDGQVRRTETGGSDLYKGYAKGDKITVFYDPQQPARARVDLWLEHWIIPTILLVPGAIILLAALLMSSTWRRDAFARPQLETGGIPVEAEFVRVRLGVDLDLDRPRAPGDFRLTEKDSRYQLTHNGKERDPYDPAVQRELGLCYTVQARRRDPKTGVERIFESEPLDTDPERLLQGRPIMVFVDPKRPDVYRMELPLKKKTPAVRAQQSPITKL